MFKRVKRPAWTCPQCIHNQPQYIRRSLVTTSNARGAAAAAIAAEDIHPVSKTATSIGHDDRTLRQIFDSPKFWKEFSSRSKHGYGAKSAGLFRNRHLTRPEGFAEFANVTLEKCQSIVASVLACNTIEGYKRMVRDLDRLSDLLCRVIDLSDFVRNVHPDRRIQAAATQAYTAMFQYMNVLNTTQGLNDQLQKASSIPEVQASWNEEEKTVAAILMRDFSKSAIDLTDQDRADVVDLSDEIAVLGTEFVDNMAAEQPSLVFPSSKLKGMDPMLVRQLTSWGTVTLPTEGMPAMQALRSVEDADTRREIYMAHRTSAQSNIDRLEQLLQRRAELAKLAQFESYGHMTLAEKMVKTPEAVTTFLDALAEENAPRVRAELQELLDFKKSDARAGNNPSALNAWDRDYYSSRLMAAQRTKTRTPDFLSAYFSLGIVFQGLSRLFHRLYGIRLVPTEPLPGETWNDDVRRLDVIDDDEGHIAVIYCDLFERPGKSPNPAHFTLRCSRRISEEELQEASSTIHSQSNSPFTTPEEAVNDGLATARRTAEPNKPLYQLPTIALICDFARSTPSASSTTPPSLLTFRELTTLFHEMGHALHSICGRTALQNVAGTRCATDFAELPSVLSENFASDPAVLALYARHWETDAPLDPARVRQRVDLDRRMMGAETESQILLGMLDQVYHSAAPLDWGLPAARPSPSSTQPESPSTALYHAVSRRYALLPEPAGTRWQGFFGHLFGYGATYYSYLFDRAIAGKIWADVFQRGAPNSPSSSSPPSSGGGAVDPAAGRLFRDEVLRWGGARDGWRCVAGVLGEERGGVLAQGGKGAMEMVGRWGVHSS